MLDLNALERVDIVLRNARAATQGAEYAMRRSEVIRNRSCELRDHMTAAPQGCPFHRDERGHDR